MCPFVQLTSATQIEDVLFQFSPMDCTNQHSRVFALRATNFFFGSFLAFSRIIPELELSCVNMNQRSNDFNLLGHMQFSLLYEISQFFLNFRGRVILRSL